MKFFLTLSLLVSGFLFSQEGSYFGKKNFVSINGLASTPLIYNLFSSNNSFKYLYKNQNGQLVQKNDLFNGGINVGISRYKSNDFGYGIEFALNFSNCRAPIQGVVDDENYFYESIQFKHEMLNILTYSIIPKIEFGIQNSSVAYGLSGTIGFGYSNSRILAKEYLSKFEDKSSSSFISYFDPEDFNSKNVFNPNVRAHGFTVLSGINLRIPITKRLLINYGLRYTFNYTWRAFDDPPEIIEFSGIGTNKGTSYEYYASDREIRNLIARSRIASLISMNIGINFAF